MCHSPFGKSVEILGDTHPLLTLGENCGIPYPIQRVILLSVRSGHTNPEALTRFAWKSMGALPSQRDDPMIRRYVQQVIGIVQRPDGIREIMHTLNLLP